MSFEFFFLSFALLKVTARRSKRCENSISADDFSSVALRLFDKLTKRSAASQPNFDLLSEIQVVDFSGGKTSEIVFFSFS